MIATFRGKYYFLSNFYETPVKYKEFVFRNNEAAFQAAKCPARMVDFTNLTASEAKRLGRRVQLRPDWEEVKEEVMYEICKEKFTHNEELKNMLLSTSGHELVEGNNWGDREWGVCDGVGQNKLGKILMKIRKELSSCQA